MFFSRPYLESADFFYKNVRDDGVIARCARFGYRSVIWRSVLDWLRKGDLFQKEILGEYATSAGRISATNYVWRILIVLHRFSIAHGSRETESRGTEQYMPFLDLFQKVYNEHEDFPSRFYEEGFSDERVRMARLLHYMNYYNRSDNNWFQFIDIQYNVNQANRKSFERWEVLYDLFFEARTAPEMLKIRITTAGKAYLGYVAPSFEFVSCMSGKLPLLCCLPTEEELENYKAEDQKCLQIIRSTSQGIRDYILDLQPQISNPNLLYHRNADVIGVPYAERIVNSAFGYLSHFTDCISRLVTVTSESAQDTKDDLIRLIISEAKDLWSAYLPPR